MEIYRFVFSPIRVNTYILADKSGNCTIIDCGCYYKSESEELAAFISNKNLNPVILFDTHCHLDHIFGNKFLFERYNLKALFCEKDERNRLDSPKHAVLFGLTMENPPEPAGYITDNQVITFGETKLVALEVPGHSAGSLAFYSEENNCVFTGDALFAGSIGRTDLEGGDYETLITSITRKLFVLPPSTIVYPGHGGDTRIEREIKSNPYFI